jgi:UDP-N-acetylglucosamine 2-epimerase (non-hydrolysing)
MKIAAVTRAMEPHASLEPFVVHTGQHYDERMSKVMFDDLQLPEPDINLEVGSSSIATQTAEIMKRFEPVVAEQRPDLVVVVGDVNSTVACAFVAKQAHVPVAHVEAGLRSRDRTMPEEINRVLTDSISDVLLASEVSGVDNLRAEGVPDEHVFFVGNVMIDTLLWHRERAAESAIHAQLGLDGGNGPYAVLTLHRPSNVDTAEAATHVLDTLEQAVRRLPVVWPIHPRTRQRLESFGLADRAAALERLHVVEPLGYLDFLKLMSEARLVMTDSGGIQEETTILHVPCLTMRDTTERPSTINAGLNRLVGGNRELLLTAIDEILTEDSHRALVPEKWDGKAGVRIVELFRAFERDGVPTR